MDTLLRLRLKVLVVRNRLMKIQANLAKLDVQEKHDFKLRLAA